MTQQLTGTETLFVDGQDSLGRPSGSTFQTTTGAIAALAGDLEIAGEYNFLDYSPQSAAAIYNGSADVTTSVQNFLLYCQLQALTLKNRSLTNLALRVYVNARFPIGQYNVSSPLINPRYVNIICEGTFVRVGSSGTATTFYNGDTTSKALANLVQPTIILTPGSHATDTLSVICNSIGSDRGSGIAVGKNWTISSLAKTSGGKSYHVNDVLTFNNPDVAPYIAAQITVNSVDGSGSILTWTLSEAGAYGLPPVLQQQQWTTANGFNVFDSHGNIGISGGNGSGASFTITWGADFTASGGGGSTYLYTAGHGGLISDTVIGHLNPVQSQILYDTTYGPIFGLYYSGLNGVFDEIESLSGFFGGEFNFCADLRINRLNSVEAGTGYYFSNCTSIECPNIVIDTPTDSSSSLEYEICGGMRQSGRIFFRSIFNNTGTTYSTIAVNQFNTGLSQSIFLDFDLQNAGSGGNSSHISSIGVPALYLAYCQAFDINLNITNHSASAAGQLGVNSTFCQFGNNVSIGRLTGSIDQTFGSLFTGTIPSTVDMDIWDADVSIINGSITATIGGTATTNDIISITFTNSNFTFTYNWPRTISYTVQGGDSLTNIAAGLVAAINSDPVLSINGVVASNSNAVITIIQMGCDANSTTLSATVSGGHTETVTFSNSGAMMGSVSGGRVRNNGIYELSGSVIPSNGSTGTGWAKAITGSKYTYLINGNLYINTGTASSPTWTQVTGNGLTLNNLLISATSGNVAAIIRGASGQNIIDFQNSGGAQVASMDSGGNLTPNSITTDFSHYYTFNGGYSGTAPSATGYITLQINGTSYYLLTSTVA